MGLRASFSLDELGYDMFTPGGMWVDYSYGCETFCEVFEREAKAYVPVLTGRLKSSISADHDGFGCTCEADTEYAEFVEYGTCYQRAQPYFEPALGMAYWEAKDEWDEAYEEAVELEQMMQAIQGAAMGGDGGGMVGGGGFLGMIILMILVAVVKGIFEVFKDILEEAFEVDPDRKSARAMLHPAIDVEII